MNLASCHVLYAKNAVRNAGIAIIIFIKLGIKDFFLTDSVFEN